jgi:ATP-dependent exoDNAse (exonuclease V) beta subunit
VVFGLGRLYSFGNSDLRCLPSLYGVDNISLTAHTYATNRLAKMLHEQNHQFSALEEERRLFYVAITRAERLLFISHIQYDHNSVRLSRSRFLEEMSSCVLSPSSGLYLLLPVILLEEFLPAYSTLEAKVLPPTSPTTSTIVDSVWRNWSPPVTQQPVATSFVRASTLRFRESPGEVALKRQPPEKPPPQRNALSHSSSSSSSDVPIFSSPR